MRATSCAATAGDTPVRARPMVLVTTFQTVIPDTMPPFTVWADNIDICEKVPG